jgi:hypothetical protein
MSDGSLRNRVFSVGESWRERSLVVNHPIDLLAFDRQLLSLSHP